jgi:hypothetical protein
MPTILAPGGQEVALALNEGGVFAEEVTSFHA